MEYSPQTPEVSTESDDDDDSERPSKKKRAGALGAYAVEPKAESTKDSAKDKAPTVWEKLLSGDKSETKEAPDKTDEESEDGAESAPLEELSETEKQYTEAQLVAALEAPTVPEASDEFDQEDLAAAEAAVENFRAKIVQEHKPSQQAYEEALREAEEPPAETVEDSPEEAEPDDEPREFDEEPIVLGPNSAEAEPDDTEDEDQAASTAAAAAASGASGAAGGGGSSAGSGSSSSGTGSGSGGGMPPRSPYYGPTASPSGSGSTAPSAATVSRLSRGRLTPSEYYYANVEPAGSFLVGGILGYLIGRRRGRIKTERRLLPIQKKLEKQVQELNSELIAKENAIRKSVLEQHFAEKHGRKPSAETMPLEMTGETTGSSQRTAAPEAQRLHVGQPKPERIGRVLVAAEATSKQPGRRPEQKPAQAPVPTEQDVMTMDREQLLAISETIVVADSSLRQIYETHLLGERGLRRLVSEHLQGKDIKRSLRQELIERQIDFERDPILRDKATANQPEGGGKTSSSFSQLLQKVNGESDRAEAEQIAMLETQADQEARRRQTQKQRRRVADLTMIATIAVLIALVALLVLRTR